MITSKRLLIFVKNAQLHWKLRPSGCSGMVQPGSSLCTLGRAGPVRKLDFSLQNHYFLVSGMSGSCEMLTSTQKSCP